MPWTFNMKIAGLIAYVPKDSRWSHVRLLFPSTRNPLLNPHVPTLRVDKTATIDDPRIIERPPDFDATNDPYFRWKLFNRDIDIYSPSSSPLAPDPLEPKNPIETPTSPQAGSDEEYGIAWLAKMARVNPDAKTVREDCLRASVPPLVTTRVLLTHGHLKVTGFGEHSEPKPKWCFVHNEDIRQDCGYEQSCAVEITCSITVPSNSRLVVRATPFGGGPVQGIIIKEQPDKGTVDAQLRHFPKSTERVRYDRDLEIDEDFLMYYFLSENSSLDFHGVPTRLVPQDDSRGRRTDCLSVAFDPSSLA
jgi:hypothetical protein